VKLTLRSCAGVKANASSLTGSGSASHCASTVSGVAVATAASEVCAAAEKTAGAAVSAGVEECVHVAANPNSSHASLKQTVAAMLSDVLNVVAMLLLQETDS